jgi:hypothetical protein
MSSLVDTALVTCILVGSFGGALLLQNGALRLMLRAMDRGRQAR